MDNDNPFAAFEGAERKEAVPVSLAQAISKYTGLALGGNSVTFNPNRAQD